MTPVRFALVRRRAGPRHGRPDGHHGRRGRPVGLLAPWPMPSGCSTTSSTRPGPPPHLVLLLCVLGHRRPVRRQRRPVARADDRQHRRRPGADVRRLVRPVRPPATAVAAVPRPPSRSATRIRRVTSDCGCVTTLVRDCGLPMAASALTLVVMAAVSFAISWPLTLVSVAVMPLMVPLFLRLGGPIADRAYEYGEAEGRGYELVERALAALPAVQAFAREPANDRALAAGYAATLAAARSANAAQMTLRVATGLLTAAGAAAVLYVGAEQVVHHALAQVGSLRSFLAYLASVYSPLESIVDGGRHVLDAAGSARRVTEVFDLDPDVTEAPDARPLAGRRGEVVLDGRHVRLRARPAGPPRPVAPRPPRRDPRPGRRQRGGQDDPRLAPAPALRPVGRPGADRRPGRPHRPTGEPAAARRAGPPAAVPVPDQRRRQHRLRPARGHAGPGRGRRRRRRRRRLHPRPGRRVRHRRRRARGHAVGRPAAAGLDRPGRPARPAAAGPGRADERPRRRDRVDRRRRPAGRRRHPDDAGHRPQAVDRPRRRPHRRPRRGAIAAVGTHDELLAESPHYADLCRHQLGDP